MQFANIGHVQLYVAAVAMGGLPLSPRTDQKFPAARFEPVTSGVTRSPYHWTKLGRGIFLFDLNYGRINFLLWQFFSIAGFFCQAPPRVTPAFVCAYFRSSAMIWVPGICMLNAKMGSEKHANFTNFWKIERMRRRWIMGCPSWPLLLKRSLAKQCTSQKLCSNSS
jgi:hypothetical protein